LRKLPLATVIPERVAFIRLVVAGLILLCPSRGRSLSWPGLFASTALNTGGAAVAYIRRPFLC
jgi:hypothetical protein